MERHDLRKVGQLIRSGYGCLEFGYERSHILNYPTTLKMKVVEITSIKVATFQNEIPRNS